MFRNLNFCTSYIKQIMNVSHSCNGTNIFIRWKMKCTIQLGFASLNGTFHLSPHENICTIALINIHYLYTRLAYIHLTIWKLCSWIYQQEWVIKTFVSLLFCFISWKVQVDIYCFDLLWLWFTMASVKEI